MAALIVWGLQCGLPKFLATESMPRITVQLCIDD